MDALEDKFVNVDTQLQDDAVKWAATFVPPAETDILSPSDHQLQNHPAKQRGSRSKKEKMAREAEKEAERSSRPNRFGGLNNNEYREVLNLDIKDILSERILGDDFEPVTGSQIGASWWTQAEKETFFTNLSRFGKSNISAIALKMQSKSALQVHEYLQILEQALIDQHLEGTKLELMSAFDFPAATQISNECCNELDVTAQAIVYQAGLDEERIERSKWGEEWLLTRSGTEWVEEELIKEGGEDAVEEVLPAAKLLNLKRMFELSEKVFMNPGDGFENEHWTSLVDPGEEIGIRATAFHDFSNLVVNLTKRLVSTAIFIAMSRLRSKAVTSFNPAGLVRRRDVHAALRMLKIRPNSRDYWTKCARRCHLRVLRTLSNKQPMDYDMVERALQETTERSFRSSSASRDDTGPDTEIDLDIDEEHEEHEALLGAESKSKANLNDQADSDVESEFHDYDPSDDSDLDPARNLGDDYLNAFQNKLVYTSESETEMLDSQTGSNHKNIRTKRALEKAHENYMESLDIKASLAEEKILWNMLKKQPPFQLTPEKIELPEKPSFIRKEAGELMDWRAGIEYMPTWEAIGKPVPETAFQGNRLKRKRSDSISNAVAHESGRTKSTERLLGADAVKLDNSQDFRFSSNLEN